MTEEYGHIPDAFHLSDKEVEDLRKSKKELTEYGKQQLRKLMTNQPIHAKISEEDYQKVLDLFRQELTQSVIPNNPLSKVQKTRTTYSKLKEKNVVEGLVSFDGEEPAWVPIETINGIYSFINKTFDGLNI